MPAVGTFFVGRSDMLGSVDMSYRLLGVSRILEMRTYLIDLYWC